MSDDMIEFFFDTDWTWWCSHPIFFSTAYCSFLTLTLVTEDGHYRSSAKTAWQRHIRSQSQIEIQTLFPLFSRPHLRIFQIFVTFDTYRQRKWCVKLAKFLDIWYQYFICSCCDECLEGHIERWHINKWVFVHYIICTIINGIQKYLGNDKQNSLISKAKEVYNLGPWSSVLL